VRAIKSILRHEGLEGLVVGERELGHRVAARHLRVWFDIRGAVFR
jgi:hypothetical protein